MRLTGFWRLLAIIATLTLTAPSANAAFVVEADNDPAGTLGKANGNFSSLPPGTGFSLSATPSTAAGLAGNQSAFGNPANTTGPDRYTFSYTPGTNADNTVYAAALVLGNSQATDVDGLGVMAPVYVNVPQLATGLTGGASGFYNVYFTTPSSTGVSITGSQFVIAHDLGSTALNPVILNDAGTGPDTTPPGGAHVGGANNLWLKIASNVPLTAGTTYTVTQTANSTAFVSQRAHGVMWEYIGPVPEPASSSLAWVGLIGACAAARRKSRAPVAPASGRG